MKTNIPLAAEEALAAGLEDGNAEIKLSLGEKARALLGVLRPAYWQALAVVSLLYFARFDASFITLRAKTVRPAYRRCHRRAVNSRSPLYTQGCHAAPSEVSCANHHGSRTCP